MITHDAATGLPVIIDTRRKISETGSRIERAESARTGALARGARVSAVGRVAGAIGENGELRLWRSPDFFGDGPLESRSIESPVTCFALTPTTLSSSKSTAVAVCAVPDGTVDVLLAEKPEQPAIHLRRKSSPTEDEFPESVPAAMLGFCRSPEGVLAAARSPASNLCFSGGSMMPRMERSAASSPAAHGIAIRSSASSGVLWARRSPRERPTGFSAFGGTALRKDPADRALPESAGSRRNHPGPRLECRRLPDRRFAQFRKYPDSPGAGARSAARCRVAAWNSQTSRIFELQRPGELGFQRKT